MRTLWSVSNSLTLQDSTIDFEKRRNIPVRYDRELVRTTITAMKRIGEIKKRREHVFWKQRLVYVRLAKLNKLKSMYQNGRSSGEEACISRQKGCKNTISQTFGTCGYGSYTIRKNTGENQDTDQEQKRSHTRRGPNDGHGCRLNSFPCVLCFIYCNVSPFDVSCFWQELLFW